jgi:ribonuclease BN (tRNA processing enzyme)
MTDHDGLSLTILGCSGSYASVDIPCSGYLVQGAGKSIVVDLGPGTLGNLQRHVALSDVDAVVLSHCHPDHWVDLSGLRTARRYTYELDGLPVYGTAETRDLARSLCSGLEPTFDWHVTTDGSTFAVGDLVFTLATTNHYVETTAIRVDDTTTGRSLAYSADTGPGWSFAALGADIDLALCEATYASDRDAEGILHLSAGQAGAMAKDAGVGHLVLTHLYPLTDADDVRAAGSAAFGAPISIAKTNKRYQA